MMAEAWTLVMRLHFDELSPRNPLCCEMYRGQSSPVIWLARLTMKASCLAVIIAVSLVVGGWWLVLSTSTMTETDTRVKGFSEKSLTMSGGRNRVDLVAKKDKHRLIDMALAASDQTDADTLVELWDALDRNASATAREVYRLTGIPIADVTVKDYVTIACEKYGSD